VVSLLLKYLPQLEIGINHPVRESFTTDTDTLKYTVTGELVHHQMRIDETYARRNIGDYYINTTTFIEQEIIRFN
jgi:hypothetical protein